MIEINLLHAQNFMQYIVQQQNSTMQSSLDAYRAVITNVIDAPIATSKCTNWNLFENVLFFFSGTRFGLLNSARNLFKMR